MILTLVVDMWVSEDMRERKSKLFFDGACVLGTIWLHCCALKYTQV